MAGTMHRIYRRKHVTQWAVGVTTAPRREATLDRSLSSLAEAGWSEPRLFVEPGTDIPCQFTHLPTSQRDQVLGAFSNWYLGLTELFLRQPHAEAYFITQDDVIYSTGLREYLEITLWPAEVIGVVSIYCPSHYATEGPPRFYEDNRGWSSWGALAYIFSNPGVRMLLADQKLINHRHHGPSKGQRNIDSVVGEWCQRQSLPYYVHTPSLAQHIGEHSTLYPRSTNAGRRKASSFISDISPCRSPLPTPAT